MTDTPSTAAGRALHAIRHTVCHNPDDCSRLHDILAIEADARAESAATIERLREALERITQTVYRDAPLDSPSYSALHLEAVGIARAALTDTAPAAASAKAEPTTDWNAQRRISEQQGALNDLRATIVALREALDALLPDGRLRPDPDLIRNARRVLTDTSSAAAEIEQAAVERLIPAMADALADASDGLLRMPEATEAQRHRRAGND